MSTRARVAQPELAPEYSNDKPVLPFFGTRGFLIGSTRTGGRALIRPAEISNCGTGKIDYAETPADPADGASVVRRPQTRGVRVGRGHFEHVDQIFVMATAERAVIESSPERKGVAAGKDPQSSPPLVESESVCFHCGEPCAGNRLEKNHQLFCCQGCLLVHDLLAESGLEQYYDLRSHPGVRVRPDSGRARWSCLDEPGVQQGLLDFTDGKISRVTLHLPAIHCVACVWLLENLFRLHAGIGQSRVNFPKREATITFTPAKIALSEVAALLVSIGYEPHLTLGALDKRPVDPTWKRQWLQIGVAGFAFGNVMLFSLPLYFGLDSRSGPGFRILFGYLSLALAAPVLVYSAADYWRSAWVAVRRRILTLDVPIALGLAALYVQSAWDILSGRGGGYLDSMRAHVSADDPRADCLRPRL